MRSGVTLEITSAEAVAPWGCGLRVIDMPGHSPGHVVLLHEPSRTLLVGDAVFNRGRLGIGPAALAADRHQRTDSLAGIPEDLDAVGFAHGMPLIGAQVDVFHEFVTQRMTTGNRSMTDPD